MTRLDPGSRHFPQKGYVFRTITDQKEYVFQTITDMERPL